jgi:hypothetical protein
MFKATLTLRHVHGAGVGLFATKITPGVNIPSLRHSNEGSGNNRCNLGGASGVRPLVDG